MKILKEIPPEARYWIMDERALYDMDAAAVLDTAASVSEAVAVARRSYCPSVIYDGVNEKIVRHLSDAALYEAREAIVSFVEDGKP